ncbi:hypothetical protein HZA44_03325 [Candidatus Peregrinibacteria bacterium]|nr:hypothetical protein [Candidatus Peregrinibacteria bacterium]
MKKSLLGLLLAVSLVLVGCTVKTGTSLGLNIENTVFATVGADDKLTVVDTPEFNRGDQVAYVLMNVGTFKKGEDGLNKFDIDMLVTDSAGKVILNEVNLLGDAGHTALPNDIAESPYGIFVTTPELDAGKYNMKLTITDKVSGGLATSTGSLTLK